MCLRREADASHSCHIKHFNTTSVSDIVAALFVITNPVEAASCCEATAIPVIGEAFMSSAYKEALAAGAAEVVINSIVYKFV